MFGEVDVLSFGRWLVCVVAHVRAFECVIFNNGESAMFD